MSKADRLLATLALVVSAFLFGCLSPQLEGSGTAASAPAFTGVLGTNALVLTEQAAPSLSLAGQAKIYAKTDHSLYASINGGPFAALGGGGGAAINPTTSILTVGNAVDSNGSGGNLAQLNFGTTSVANDGDPTVIGPSNDKFTLCSAAGKELQLCVGTTFASPSIDLRTSGIRVYNGDLQLQGAAGLSFASGTVNSALTFGTGLGAVVQLRFPSDQDGQVWSGVNRDLYLSGDRGSGYFVLTHGGSYQISGNAGNQLQSNADGSAQWSMGPSFNDGLIESALGIMSWTATRTLDFQTVTSGSGQITFTPSVNSDLTFATSGTGLVSFKNGSTGSGSAALGANSPAVTNTAPYTWLKLKSPDGSTVYVPAWK